MDARQRQDLDNYITGHWGEDQIQDPDTVHFEYVMSSTMSRAYDYDPADDGPEVEICKAILASHTVADLTREHTTSAFRFLIGMRKRGVRGTWS